MKLTLKRMEFREDGILSYLKDEAGNVLFKTLEHSYDKYPKLYNGEFKCVRGIHQLHGGKPFETFEITGVKGHSGILFHVGNFNRDSDGCVLVGKDFATDPSGAKMVVFSRKAFAELIELLRDVDEFQLIVQ